MPVQAATKYELIINLKTAKALDLTAVAACHSRRGDRLGSMSAIGTKRTSLVAPHMSAFGDKADMTIASQNVG